MAIYPLEHVFSYALSQKLDYQIRSLNLLFHAAVFSKNILINPLHASCSTQAANIQKVTNLATN